MKDFCVVGSGIAGATIANQLAKKYSVEVFDKARGISGRASNRRYRNTLSFDHGLQYISPKNKEFEKFIIQLKNKKIIKLWGGKHLNYKSDTQNKKIKKYIGKKANTDICKYLLKNIKTHLLSEVVYAEYKNNYWLIKLKNKKELAFKKIILAIPYPQAKKLIKKYLSKKILDLNIKMDPNITVMAIFKNSLNLKPSSIKFNDKILGWAANENSKCRFRSNLQLWTLQSNIKWAKKNINIYKLKKKIVANKVINQFCKLLHLKIHQVIFFSIHGWKYSFNTKKTKVKSYWNNKYNLGLCGDWFLGPKAEHAWLSASNLYKKIR
jgi:predicted NAD/FAD-dependent oxidoreductase